MPGPRVKSVTREGRCTHCRRWIALSSGYNSAVTAWLPKHAVGQGADERRGETPRSDCPHGMTAAYDAVRSRTT